MVTTLRSRPNHYELLGLTPRATSDEIARAFAREIGPFRPHAFGDVTQVSLAYAVLRDPTRRRAYDESLGLLAKPRPQPQVSMTGRLPPFVAAAPTAARAAVPQPRQAIAEPRTASFIAASLREPQSAEPQAEAQAETQAEAKAEPQPVAPFRTPPVAIPPSLRRVSGTRLVDVESELVEWKRAAIVGGAVVVAVGLLGAVAGMQAGNDAEAQQSERAVTLALPQARPRAAVAAPGWAPVRNVAQGRSERSRHPLLARAERVQAERQPVARQEQEPTVAVRNPPELNPAEDAAAEAPAATAAVVAAKMPLANATIARTIARIGYPCGAVSSTAAGGAPGVFTVTCTSGHSYQASPVRGRYRFRHLSSH